ncbi:SKP1/BTB/POZ domain superfamily [Sesbania bispinosa]|nr:SKP1/BTB/POZ domain superfamily [Sesbania bispinosa]
MEDESTSHTSERIKLNVGGKLFETTLSTIRSGGPDSLLFALSNRGSNDSNPLADEAQFYGIDSHLRSATSPPSFSGIDASIVASIRPASEGLPSTFTAADNGSVWIAHGGQLSSYDWNLLHAATIRTHLDEIDSICRVWPETAAVGTQSDAGLHFYNFSGSRHVGSVHWSDPSDPRIFKARVNAITASENSVFASFDCPHRENCILEVDKGKLQIVSQLGRQSGNQAKHMVPSKLTFVPATGVLLGSAVAGGAFGYSGDLAVADMRRLGDDPWVYLKEKNPSLVNSSVDGSSSAVHCYKGQVFVARGGELEVWSTVEEVVAREWEGDAEGFYRRNFVDKREDSERGLIKKIEGGGDRLFVSREDVEGIEVWESSHSPGAISDL